MISSAPANMPPSEPEIGKDYVLVKLVGPDIACARYHRFYDGSAGYFANHVYAKAIGMNEKFFPGGVVCSADGSASAWKPVWDELMKFGFVEIAQAQQAGIVPEDWQPPSQYLSRPERSMQYLVVSDLAQPPSVAEVAALRRIFPALADCPLTELREHLKTSSRWVVGRFAKDVCLDLQARGQTLGLHIEFVEELMAAIPALQAHRITSRPIESEHRAV